MERYQESNEGKRQEEHERTEDNDETVESESLLNCFIEYEWDERDGHRTGGEDRELMSWMRSRNFLVRNKFRMRLAEINARNMPRILLTDEIRSNEHLLREAQETNNNIKYAQLVYNLKEILYFLTRNGEDVNNTNEYDYTIMHIFLQQFCDITESLPQKKLSRLRILMKKLLAKGASVYTINRFRVSPLLLVAWSREEKIIETIISCCLEKSNSTVEPRIVTECMRKVLETHTIPPDIIAMQHDYEVLRIIVTTIDNGTYRRDDGNGALHRAIYDLNYELEDKYTYVIQILVCNGATVNRKNCKGMAPLHLASERFLIDVLKIFADNGGGDFAQCTDANQTPIHLACKSSWLLKDTSKVQDTIDFLIGKDCDVLAVDDKGLTPMDCLVQSMGEIDQDTFSPEQQSTVQFLVKQLIERGASLHTFNKHGKSSLHLGAMGKNKKLLEVIIDCLNDVNACDENGNTALHEIIDNCVDDDVAQFKVGYFDVIQTLVSRGANLNKANKKGLTPAHVAAAKFHVEILKFFNHNGADFKLHTQEDKSALHIACKSSLQIKDRTQAIETIDFLVNQGCNVDAHDKKGFLPLHYAAETGNVEIVKRLIELKANVNCHQTKDFLLTPFHLAAKNDRLNVMKKLIESGADVNIEASDGTTPIFQSTLFGSYESFRYLSDQGADLHRRDEYLGFTLLHFLACGPTFEEQLDNVETNKIDEETKKFDFLVKIGLNVNDPGSCDITPLQLASLVGNESAVKTLIEYGANVNFQSDLIELTALHCASLSKSLKITKMLIKAGADVNCRGGTEQQTPLHLALATNVKWRLGKYRDNSTRSCQMPFSLPDIRPKYESNENSNHFDIISLLIENGADVNVKDSSGKSPLHFAALQFDSRFSKMLLEAGARPNVQDNKRLTPLYNALESNQTQIFEELLNFGAHINDLETYYEILRSDKKVDMKVLTIKHGAKLELLGLPLVKHHNKKLLGETLKHPTFASYCINCSIEKERLEKHYIGDLSLYKFLRMNVKLQYLFADKISNSYKELETLFPLYFGIIRGVCREAINRKSLLVSARMASHQIFKIHLPDLCIEAILSYLNNQYLDTFVESANPLEKVVFNESKEPVLHGVYY